LNNLQKQTSLWRPFARDFDSAVADYPAWRWSPDQGRNRPRAPRRVGGRMMSSTPARSRKSANSSSGRT